MTMELAPAQREHVDELGRICYEAFKDISDRHGFPSDFTSAAFARRVIGSLVRREDVYGVAALMNGEPVGSTFMSVTDDVGGIGPVSVEVPAQGQGVGRALMQDVLEYARRNNVERVRLLQDGFNMVSLSLYASLGFDVVQATALMQPAPASQPDDTVRPVTEADLPAVEELSRRIYRVSRRHEVEGAMRATLSPPLLRERQGHVTGYFVLGIAGHGVAESEDDALALIGQAARTMPPEYARFFCPLSLGGLYRKAMQAGHRTIKVMNLMALGPYEPPDGVWMPSVLY